MSGLFVHGHGSVPKGKGPTKSHTKWVEAVERLTVGETPKSAFQLRSDFCVGNYRHKLCRYSFFSKYKMKLDYLSGFKRSDTGFYISLRAFSMGICLA